MMDRGAAHAAIVLILSDVPKGYRFTDIADDILDAIWPDPAAVWAEGHDAGWENRGLVQTGQLVKVDVFNPYRPHLPDPKPYPSGKDSK